MDLIYWLSESISTRSQNSIMHRKLRIKKRTWNKNNPWDPNGCFRFTFNIIETTKEIHFVREKSEKKYVPFWTPSQKYENKPSSKRRTMERFEQVARLVFRFWCNNNSCTVSRKECDQGDKKIVKGYPKLFMMWGKSIRIKKISKIVFQKVYQKKKANKIVKNFLIGFTSTLLKNHFRG